MPFVAAAVLAGVAHLGALPLAAFEVSGIGNRRELEVTPVQVALDTAGVADDVHAAAGHAAVLVGVEGGTHAVFVLDDRHLVIDDVLLGIETAQVQRAPAAQLQLGARSGLRWRILQAQAMGAFQVTVAAVQGRLGARREHRTAAERGHPARQRAGEPGEDVQVVAALLQQVAAGELAEPAPVTVEKRPLRRAQVLVRLDTHQAAQVAALEAPLQLAVERRVAQHEADDQMAFGGARRVPDRLAVGHGGGHRLLAEHVLAVLEGGDRGLPVGMVGRAHQHQVHVVAPHHLAVAGHHAGLRSQLRPHPLGGARSGIVQGGDARPAERPAAAPGYAVRAPRSPRRRCAVHSSPSIRCRTSPSNWCRACSMKA